MNNQYGNQQLTRRELLRITSAGALGLATNLAVPRMLSGEDLRTSSSSANRYADVLKTWCDGLLAHQVTAIQDPAVHGALLCPACAMIHGRCADAVYPLLHVAHATGDAKYVQAAIAVHNWSEQQ